MAYEQTVRALRDIHETDPSYPSSLEYHESLVDYTRLLSKRSPIEPLHTASEALLLAANAQHVARWKRPRADYPLGLTGYKLWRVSQPLTRNLLAPPLVPPFPSRRSPRRLYCLTIPTRYGLRLSFSLRSLSSV